MNFGRDAIGCSILGDSLVVIGGYNGSEYLKVVEEYDPETNSFKELAPVNYSRGELIDIKMDRIRKYCLNFSGQLCSCNSQQLGGKCI